MIKNKDSNKEEKINSEIFVNAVLKNKNIKASKYLEKIIQNKCAKKIKNVLSN